MFSYSCVSLSHNLCFQLSRMGHLSFISSHNRTHQTFSQTYANLKSTRKFSKLDKCLRVDCFFVRELWPGVDTFVKNEQLIGFYSLLWQLWLTIQHISCFFNYTFMIVWFLLYYSITILGSSRTGFLSPRSALQKVWQREHYNSGRLMILTWNIIAHHLT